MGSGASNLNDEQRAHVAKLMKENYEKSVNTVPPEEMQKHMEKLYEELLTSLKPAAPLDAQRHENMKKKQTPTRRRSFGDDKSKKKNLPPKPPARTESNSHHEPQPTHHHEGDHAASHEEAPPHNEENVDSWDSVHAQPSCPLCKMIFATQSKYDTHVKYSEVHAQNIAKQKQQAEAAARPSSAPKVIEPSRPLSAPPGPRCRELYTGSKFFWRYKQTVEIHLYLHLDSRCIEICSYNNHLSQEYPRVYLDEPSLVKLIGTKALADKVNDLKDNIPSQEPTPPDEILEEEAKRLLNSAHIMNRIQYKKDPNANPQETIEYTFSPSLENPDLPSPLLATAPQGLIPVMIARRRLSTTKEIESAFESFHHLGAELLNSTEKAGKIIEKLTQENEQLLQQSNQEAAVISARRHSK